MKTLATVLQITRGLLILTPAEYDKPEGGFASRNKRSSSMPTTFNVPQIFELNDSLKDHPFEKTEELAAFVKRCAASVSMELGDLFICIEDEDVLITKEYKHAPAKEKLLPTFARVEAENVLHQEVDKYTILNFEYGQQYGKANKSDEISASLFAMNTGMLTDIRASFEKEGIRVVKVTPPIAGMLYTCKEDVNSATRAIAVISMDFAATRLVVLHNGAPVFQQSYTSILEDIAELFSLEFGMSKMGAIDLIRKEGLGVCSKCKSTATQKQTMSMLDNAAGEILRNLRMVISTKRLDIDEIVLIDALAKLPNISGYCRNVGLTAPMENITRIFSGGSQPPVASASASERDFDTTSFITLNGVLTMPINEANLIMGESNILTAMANESSGKIGKIVAGAIGGIAALWMIGISGWWLALEFQKKNDTSQLNDPTYNSANQIIADEALWQKQVADINKNLELLPKTSLKSADVVTQVFEQIVDKVDDASEFSVNNDDHTIKTTIAVKDIETFVKFKNSTNEEKYFTVGDAISVSNVTDPSIGGQNPVQYTKVDITLTITPEAIAAAEAAQEEEDAKKAEEAASAENTAEAETPVTTTEDSGQESDQASEG